MNRVYWEVGKVAVVPGNCFHIGRYIKCVKDSES